MKNNPTDTLEPSLFRIGRVFESVIRSFSMVIVGLTLTTSGICNAQDSQTPSKKDAEIIARTKNLLDKEEYRHLRNRRKNEFKRSRKRETVILRERKNRTGRKTSKSETKSKTDTEGNPAKKQDRQKDDPDSRNRRIPDNEDSRYIEDRNGESSELSEGLGFFLTMIAWLFVGAIVVLILFLIVRSMSSLSFDGSLSDDSEEPSDIEGVTILDREAPSDLPANKYLALAKRCAQDANFEEAIAHLVLGAMSIVEKANMIQFRKGLTYSDYLRVTRSDKNIYGPFRTIVRIYQPIGFGRRVAKEDHYRRALDGFEELNLG